MGIALCRTLTEEPDLLNRVISSLESAVLDEIVGRQRNKPLNPAELSESFVGAIAELLIEAFSMSRTFAGFPGRAALPWVSCTRMKVMQPTRDVTRARFLGRCLRRPNQLAWLHITR